MPPANDPKDVKPKCHLPDIPTERETLIRQTIISLVRFDLRMAESFTGAWIRWTSSGGHTPGNGVVFVFVVFRVALLRSFPVLAVLLPLMR